MSYVSSIMEVLICSNVGNHLINTDFNFNLQYSQPQLASRKGPLSDYKESGRLFVRVSLKLGILHTLYSQYY